MPVRSERILIAALASSLAALWAVGWAFGRDFKLPYPPLSAMKVRPDDAVETAGFLSLGLRRGAADVGFVRLLQYYGTPEGEFQFAFLAPIEHGESPYEGGVYPEMYARGREIIDLDPYFDHAAEYAIGSLAFNLNRPLESIDLLERVRKYNPKQWRYDALLAAVGYLKAKNPEKVADSLLPVALDPDSPAMVKQETAFLLKKIGRNAQAVRVYQLLILTTKDEGYIDNARRNIALLTQPAPGN
jgi:tetratricopeptide (TPR) repeat protein